MRDSMLILVLLFGGLPAWAQAPVEERPSKQPALRHSQLKADFARKEKEQAAERVRQIETELAEAQQAQQNAEKNLQMAQQHVVATQKKLTQVQDRYRQAESKATQTEAEVGRAWQK